MGGQRLSERLNTVGVASEQANGYEWWTSKRMADKQARVGSACAVWSHRAWPISLSAGSKHAWRPLSERHRHTRVEANALLKCLWKREGLASVLLLAHAHAGSLHQ